MSIEFTPATRASSKARIALVGPSGAGKTYTALALATTLADEVAVIDTERGRASLYAGVNGWSFATFNPRSFSPLSLTEALAVAGGRFGCVVVDSLSHYWMGVDGMLEQADKRAKGGNSFSGWKEARPDERRMLDALASYPGHVIVTLRTKTEYVIEEDDRGKKAPRKVGTKPEQREGVEYEFDLVGDLDLDNTLTVSKSRIPALSHSVVPHPGPELAETIREWLEDGEDAPDALSYRERAFGLDGRDELLALYREAERAGLLGAAVLGEDDKPTTLGALITARGSAAKQRGEA